MRLAPGSAFVAGASGDPSDDTQSLVGEMDGQGILVPLLASKVPVVTDQLRVGAALARSTGASLRVLDPLAGAGEPPAERDGDLTDEAEDRLVEWAIDRVSAPSRGGLLDTRTLIRRVLDAVAAGGVDTLVVPSGSASGVVRRGITDRLALHADCDVITVNGRPGYGRVPSILLAVAGGPHSGLATDVAARVAGQNDAWVDVLNVVPEDPTPRVRDEANDLVEATARRIGRPDSTATWVLEGDDPSAAIVEQSSYYGLTVVGAPSSGRLRRFISGSTNRSIRSNAHSVVISARSSR